MTKKIVSLMVAIMLVAGIFGGVTASAAALDLSTMTSAELTQLLSQLTALLGGSAATPAATTPAATTFAKDLSVGMTNDDVMALQLALNVEVGTSLPGTRYFGPLTKAAVIKFQTANGIPGTGYVGPLTRAALNAKQSAILPPVSTENLPAGCTSAVGFSATTGTSCATVSTLPAGCTSAAGYSPTTGTACSSTTGGSTSGITTPGVEGTLTVTANPTPGSGLTVREGDVKKSVLGLKLEAKTSDISVQRVKIDLGSSTIFYNKLFKHIYLLDGSTVIAESDLDSSTIVKDGTTYYITLTGFNVIVPKDTTKVLTLALDAYTSIDSTYDAVTTYGLLIPADAVRGVDGAGLNQTGPATALTRRTVTIDATAAVDSATMVVSKNSASPVAQTIVANDGTADNEKDDVTFLVFNLKGTKDTLTVTDLNASIVMTAGGVAATTSTAYLKDGDTTVGSATVTAKNGMIYFTDLDITVEPGTTKTLTLTADIRSADTTATVFTASTTGSGITVENSEGTAVVPTGSALGSGMTVMKSGAQLDLVSVVTDTPVIVNLNTTTGKGTTTVNATFKVKVTAVGGSVLLGGNASSTPFFGTTSVYALIYKGGASNLGITQVVASSTSVIFDENTIDVSGNTATLTDGNSTVVTLTYYFAIRNQLTGADLGIGDYAVGIEGLKWVGPGGLNTSTFMAGKTAWRSAGTSVSQ